MILLIEDGWVDVGMAKVVNQCFLTLVYTNYWKLIEDGKLRPGSPESDLLLTSVRVSLSPYRADLVDYDWLHDKVIDVEDGECDALLARAVSGVSFATRDEPSESITKSLTRSLSTAFSAFTEEAPDGVARTGCIANVVSSWRFNV